jgi:serine-protein kinase ATM
MGSLRYEGLWATVATIARMSSLLDDRKRRLVLARNDDEETTVKRVKVSLHFDEFLRHVSETRSNAKRAALNVISFIVQDMFMEENTMQSLLEKLTPLISDENSAHSSWALIALSASVF